jgi:hypothetical protein
MLIVYTLAGIAQRVEPVTVVKSTEQYPSVLQTGVLGLAAIETTAPGIGAIEVPRAIVRAAVKSAMKRFGSLSAPDKFCSPD